MINKILHSNNVLQTLLEYSVTSLKKKVNTEIDMNYEEEERPIGSYKFHLFPSRVKEVKKPTLKDVFWSTGTFLFDTKAVTGAGSYQQTIRYDGYKNALRQYRDGKYKDIADMLEILRTRGNISVHCNCPSFLYWGFQYIASDEDFVWHTKEKRPPKLRNPIEIGGVCKHIYKVLEEFKGFIPKMGKKIESELKKRGLDRK